VTVTSPTLLAATDACTSALLEPKLADFAMLVSEAVRKESSHFTQLAGSGTLARPSRELSDEASSAGR
jgi:hypothetical protein